MRRCAAWQPPPPQNGPTTWRMPLPHFIRARDACLQLPYRHPPSCRTYYNFIQFCRQILKRHLEKLIAYQGKDFIKVIFFKCPAIGTSVHSAQTPIQGPQRPFFPDLRAPPLEMMLLLQPARQASFHTVELWDANREKARDERGQGTGAGLQGAPCVHPLMLHTPQV